MVDINLISSKFQIIAVLDSKAYESYTENLLRHLKFSWINKISHFMILRNLLSSLFSRPVPPTQTEYFLPAMGDWENHPWKERGQQITQNHEMERACSYQDKIIELIVNSWFDHLHVSYEKSNRVWDSTSFPLHP